MIKNIHALRAIAAMMVVLYHLQDCLRLYLGHAPHFMAGTAGVDIFFVISGFIMVHTNIHKKRSPAGFMVDRVIRVIPLYWMATAIIVMLVLIGFQPGGQTRLSAESVIKSFLLIAYPATNGSPSPIHYVGWTLVYEVYFYLIFGLCLFLRSLKLITIALVVFLGLSVALFFTPASQNFFVSTYANPILLEFLAGVLLAVIYESPAFESMVSRFRLASRIIAPIMIATGVAAIVMYDFQPHAAPFTVTTHLTAFGLSALLLVAGALLAEKAGMAVENRLVFLLGSASYSIYLFHPMVIQPVTKVWMTFIGAHTPILQIVMAAAAWTAAISVGVFMYLFVEKPMHAWMRRKSKALWPAQKAASLPLE